MVGDGRLVMRVGTLSMAAILVETLLRRLPRRPRLVEAAWHSTNFGQTFYWKAATEPLRFHHAPSPQLPP